MTAKVSERTQKHNCFHLNTTSINSALHAKSSTISEPELSQ